MTNRKEMLPPEKMDWGSPRQWLIQLLSVLVVAGVWLVLLLVLAIGQELPPSVGPTTGDVAWDDTVGPLLLQHCGVCHGEASGLSLATYEDTLSGGQRGPAIVPGDGEGSLLVRSLRGTHPGLARMPLNRAPLPDDVIDNVSAWIDAGAPKAK